MFDFLRDRGSDEEKRQEVLSAYLDNALTPEEKARIESRLAGDPRLQADLEQLRLLRLQLRAMPRRRVPRSFALDPAVYGRPKAQPLLHLQPVLRGATAFAAFLLIFTLALGAYRGQFTGGLASESAPMNEVLSADTAGQEAASLDQAVPMEEAAPAAAEIAPETARESYPPAEGELAAAEVAPEEAAAGAALAPEGTGIAIPEGDLSIESITAATATPEILATLEVAAFATESPVPTPTMAVTEAEEIALQPEETTGVVEGMRVTPLPVLQIAVGVVFLVSLALWLIARRRARRIGL